MNHFFAIELPDKARAEVAAFADRWKQQIDPAFHARWYPPEDYHLTIKFLGDISEPLVSKAKSIAIEVALQWEPILVAQKPIVTFPGIIKPHVLWIEVFPNDALNFLQGRMKYPLWALGIKPDFRPFKPHITLARCNPDANVPPFILGEHAFGEFTAIEFVLMQTLPPEKRANGTKSRYNIVHTFPLGNGHSSDVS